MLERRNVVNALADERSFVKRVLVDIGHRTRIGIDSNLAGMHFRVARTIGAGQRRRDARLQDAMADANALAARA